MFSLGALIPAWFMAVDLLPHLATWWLVIFGGGIVGVTVAMMIVSVAGRSVVWLARCYVVLVAVGTAAWPPAWTSPEPASGNPWLWMCLGVASVWTAVTTGVKWGFGYAVLTSAIYAGVRLTPSGQGVPLMAAMQDMLVLVINPSAVIIGVSLLTDAVRRLDATTSSSQQQRARAALEEALVEQRRQLDSIVHDEVMTTLVNATMSPAGRHPRLAEQARHAIDQLDRAGETTEERVPVTVEHLGWLVRDQVISLVPDAQVAMTVSEPELPVPAKVASAIGQACREAAMNIARHAEASHVSVLIDDAPGHGVRITLTDDGTGFDPGAVPGDRFGLRLSVHERMAGVGGQAEVSSQPGRGTSVELIWRLPDETTRADRRSRVDHDPRYAVVPSIRPGLLAGLIALLIGLHFVLGWTTLDQVTGVWPVFMAQLLATLATWLALRNLNRVALPTWSAAGVVVLLTGTTLLVQSVLPYDRWPGYATWHSGVVMVLVIVLLFRRQRLLAWSGLSVFVAASLWWALSHGLGVDGLMRVSFGPVAWMVVAQLISSWLIDIGNRMRESDQHSDAANQAIAASYSKLVLRDLWLGELRTQVGPLLSRLADPEAELSDAERAACASLERRLRDGLRAANLLADGTQDLVEAARARGVEVRLVDSRGSALPDPVRRAVNRSLAAVLADHEVTRVVARAAPEDYDDVVTILTVRRNGRTELVGLDNQGNPTAR